MKLREIAFVFLRLIAIWLFIDLAIPNLWSTVFYLTTPEIFSNKNGVIFFYTSQAVVYFVLSFVLWFFAKRISVIIYKDETEVEAKDGNEKYLERALTIIGVYLVVSYLPGFVASVYSFFIDKSLPIKNYSGNIKNLIQTVAGIFIGLICINGKIDIVGLIKKLRTN